MKLRLTRRPATGADEFPASLVNRALQANGYVATRSNRDVIRSAVVENPVNGYVDIVKDQKLCAAMMFSRRPKRPEDDWLAGAICTACIAEGGKLSLVAAHPDFAVCVRHGLKLHAYCPNCRTPTSWTWLEHQRCSSCRAPIRNFPKQFCTEAEHCTAKAVHAWLSGATDSQTNEVLTGLWSVPLQRRPSVLRALVSTALPRPRDPTFAEQQLYFTKCRHWLLTHAGNWRDALLLELANRVAPPPRHAGFAAACRWLGCALNHGERTSSWPIKLSAAAFELLPALLGGDFLQRLDRLLKSSRLSEASRDIPPVQGQRQRVTCQWPLKLPGYYRSEPVVSSLGLLNQRKQTWPRRQTPPDTVYWRRRPRRYLFRSPRDLMLDAYELSIRQVVAGVRSSGKPFVSLGALRRLLPQHSLSLLETALLQRHLPCYLINRTGNYRRDIGLHRADFANWKEQQQGGQYVIPLCA